MTTIKRDCVVLHDNRTGRELVTAVEVIGDRECITVTTAGWSKWACGKAQGLRGTMFLTWLKNQRTASSGPTAPTTLFAAAEPGRRPTTRSGRASRQVPVDKCFKTAQLPPFGDTEATELQIVIPPPHRGGGTSCRWCCTGRA